MRRWRLLAACSVLLASGLAPTGARAHVGSTGTFLLETFVNAGVDVSPGLCAPGDTPGCVGPQVAQFRVLSDACTMSGRFEGTDLAPNSPCGFELYGFMTGLAPGTKPSCSGLRFVTSDETTAWGDGNTSKLIVNGTPRDIYIEGATIGITAIFTTVWWDDDDSDIDPVGDHSSIAPPAPSIRQSGGSGVGCVTAPVTRTLLPAGMAIDY